MSDVIPLNGVNGGSGAYLVEAELDELAKMALEWDVDKAHKGELKFKAEAGKDFVISPQYDPQKLAEAGWGVIFPARADAAHVKAIMEAMGELLVHRQKEAGERYKVYYEKGSGYRPGESKNKFLARSGAGPGPVDPTKVPYYLLIVADPQGIPYQFQYELDVDYSVGRIYFETLDEYAQYARSVVEAETPGKVKLPREAVFFSVANEDDRATNLSDEMLVRPLAEYSKSISKDKDLGWHSRLVPPEQATKDTLGQLLGGSQTPALLFTASHGLGWDYEHPNQKAFQGALLCQDWPGPEQWKSKEELPRDFYFGAEDVAGDAGLLGMIAFHFACFGAGTPYWDAFATGKSREREALAPRAFLSALPKRLLSHPRGGAMAVIGHVERAWTYSFKWKEAAEQTEAFKAVLYMLLKGAPVGLAVEYMNLRYASIATMLSNELEEIKWDQDKYDPYTLSFMWTANNDARGYAIIGDPAARIPVVEKGEQAAEQWPAISVDGEHPGKLPEVLVAESQPEKTIEEGVIPAQRMAAPTGAGAQLGSFAQPASYAQPYTVLDGLAAASRYTAMDEEDFASLGDAKDAIVKVVDSLGAALNNLSTKLAEFTEKVSSLDVETYASANLDEVDLQNITGSGAKKRLLTRVTLDGDVKLVLPEQVDELDEKVWELHLDMVRQAQENRLEMIKATTKALADLLTPAKPE